MNPVEYLDTHCPWCAEMISLEIECIEPEQEYIEDCPVCCAPMLVSVRIPCAGPPWLQVEREGG
jgi:hypothetical protein